MGREQKLLKCHMGNVMMTYKKLTSSLQGGFLRAADEGRGICEDVRRVTEGGEETQNETKLMKMSY